MQFIDILAIMTFASVALSNPFALPNPTGEDSADPDVEVTVEVDGQAVGSFGIAPSGCITCAPKPKIPVCVKAPPKPAPATCKKTPPKEELKPDLKKEIPQQIYLGGNNQLTTVPSAKPCKFSQKGGKLEVYTPTGKGPAFLGLSPHGADGPRILAFDNQEDIEKSGCKIVDLKCKSMK